MKKYLFTALLGVFGLFGAFVSAGNLNIIHSGGGYNPSSISFSNDTVLSLSSFSNYSCSDNCVISIKNDNYSCEFYYYGGELYLFENSGESNSCNLLAGNYNFSLGDDEESTYFSSITISYGDSSSSEGDSEESGTLLPTGTGALSGIITNLGTTISEFIPYLVFIGLGLLGAIIGFVAIKWLINRVRAKVYGTFSGGRRK